MKQLFFLLALLSTTVVLSSEATLGTLKACKTYPSYISSGWKIQDPALFKKFENKIVETVRVGLEKGSIIFDMSGPIQPKHTVNNQHIILDAISWDLLKTSQDLMHGDYAFLEVVNDNHDMAELRWFDGVQRNIVINPKFLTCFSEVAPYVENSIL